MAFYEREFIEIKRQNVNMEIVGTLKCSVEREDVRKYILSRIAKEKRAMAIGGVLAIITWLLAAVPVVGELFLTNNPNPHLGGGTLALTVNVTEAVPFGSKVPAAGEAESHEGMFSVQFTLAALRLTISLVKVFFVPSSVVISIFWSSPHRNGFLRTYAFHEMRFELLPLMSGTFFSEMLMVVPSSLFSTPSSMVIVILRSEAVNV